MINVSNTAREQVRIYFEDKEVQPIRIFVNSGGCGGAQLVMALDEKKDDDAVFTVDNVDYVMEKKLMDEAAPVEVDYTGMGFKIESSLKLGGGCGSCTSTGSCCS